MFAGHRTMCYELRAHSTLDIKCVCKTQIFQNYYTPPYPPMCCASSNQKVIIHARLILSLTCKIVISKTVKTSRLALDTSRRRAASPHPYIARVTTEKN